MTENTSKSNKLLTTNRAKTYTQLTRKNKRLILVPADLKKAIENLKLKPQTRDCCINLVCYIYLSFNNRKEETDNWISLSQIHFEKNVSTDYIKSLKILKDKKVGIIECQEYYYYDYENKGQCKKYRINPDLLKAELVPIRFKGKVVSYQNTTIVQRSLKDLNKLKIMVDGKYIKSYSDLLILKSTIENHINEEWFLENHKNNSLNADKLYDYWIWRVDSSNSMKRKKIEDLKATYPYKDLVWYKRKVVVTADKEEFITYKVREIREKIWNSLASINDKYFVCNRNSTNNRLDTNLTNLKNDYIKLLRFEGESLVSIDLKNSQFVIFAHLLEACWNFLNSFDKNKIPKILSEPQILTEVEKYRFKGYEILKEKIEEVYLNIIISIMCQEFFVNNCLSISYDCLEFMKMAKTGVFYENFKDILKEQSGEIIDRSDAKSIMFLVAFSSHNYNPDEKRIFSKSFPSISYLIDEFKRRMQVVYSEEYGGGAKDKGNASFAVMLQKIESAIFIDDLLPKLWKAGFKVFTKHDSFLVKESQAKEAEAFIRAEFDVLFGVDEYIIAVE